MDKCNPLTILKEVPDEVAIMILVKCPSIRTFCSIILTNKECFRRYSQCIRSMFPNKIDLRLIKTTFQYVEQNNVAKLQFEDSWTMRTVKNNYVISFSDINLDDNDINYIVCKCCSEYTHKTLYSTNRCVLSGGNAWACATIDISNCSICGPNKPVWDSAIHRYGSRARCIWCTANAVKPT